MYVCELTKRRYRGKKPKVIRGPDDVVALVGPKLRKEKRENFLVLLLNARHKHKDSHTRDPESMPFLTPRSRMISPA